MRVFVVIPAYNEEKRIAQVLKDLSDLSYEVLVVDDASSDKTVEIAGNWPVYILKHRLNRDQGAALETGNQFALSQGADAIVHFDADGQFLASEIGDLLEPIISGQYDIVFGSRFLGKQSKIPWLKKILIFPMARLVNRVFMGIKFSDPQNGFRAMTADAARLLTIEQDGKAHCSEIAAKAVQASLRIKEVPITVIYHEFGQGFGGGIKIVKDILFSKLLK